MYIKRILFAVLLVCALSCAAVYADEPAPYAQEPVRYLKANTEIEDKYFTNYKSGVSREEFTYYSTLLYYKLKDEEVKLVEGNPFSDTDSPYVATAAYLEIANGMSATEFVPDELITREQITAMFMRTLARTDINYSKKSTSHLKFNDENSISGWALDDIKRAYYIGIINGVAENTIAPLDNVTREQAFTLIYNILSNLQKIQGGYTRGITLAAPTLKYSGVGKYDTGWVEEAYNSSPAVADLNGDGNLEIISAAYSILCIDAKSGAVNWRVNSGHDRNSTSGTNYVGRAWADPIIKDIDGDGMLEIVLGHGDGTVAVYTWDGYFKNGWPKKPVSDEIKSIKVCDLELDGTCEIVVGAGVEQGTSVWVYEHDGTVRRGWPQLDSAADATKNPVLEKSGYAWGVFNDNISVGDINGDGYPDIVVPTDVPFICAYNHKGVLLNANPKYGGRSWGKIGVWENAAFEDTVENEGWGLSIDWRTGAEIDLTTLPREQRYTANFAFGKSIITDLDGNGTNEIVVTGNVYDRAYGYPPPGKYQGLFIFNGDRSRFKNQKYDWTQIPTDLGAPLSEDWSEIELCMPDPVAEDLDMDGEKEIIFPSYDGDINCFKLDKTSWRYTVYNGSVKEFPSAAAVVDLDYDGYKEVICATFTAKNSRKVGSLYIFDKDGNVLSCTQLPDSLGNSIPNGCLGAPTVSDIDGDGRYEIILNTYLCGVVVYDV